ncbi:MAG: hypothetical protein KF874_14095 [Rhizobiaceae bacterium]|nr:hypothetical protein [Rhizobiaceae bacterium]
MRDLIAAREKGWYDAAHGTALFGPALQGIRAAGQETPAGSLLCAGLWCADESANGLT